MLTEPRQIVLDKSAFIAFKGRQFDALCDLAKRHCLFVSEVLLYECVTSAKLKNERLLSQCHALLQAGAYYCSRSEDLMRWEGQHLRPFPRRLADVRKTERLRAGPAREDHAFSDAEIAAKREVGIEFAKAFLLDNIRRLRDINSGGHVEGLPDPKGLPPDKPARLAVFAASANLASFRHLAIALVPKNLVKDQKRFCLSAKWMTWQYLRLIDIVLREYCCRFQTGGSLANEDAEHDYQDTGYVSLLSRADGIITQDKGLTKLARAAFPGKDVFSSLDEVPESYRCD